MTIFNLGGNFNQHKALLIRKYTPSILRVLASNWQKLVHSHNYSKIYLIAKFFPIFASVEASTKLLLLKYYRFC